MRGQAGGIQAGISSQQRAKRQVFQASLHNAGEYPQRADNSLEDKQNAGQGRKAQALELILCDEGLAKHNDVTIPEYAGCEYCNGVTEWSEKLGADGKEVRFEFCPVCGRMIEEG